MGRSLLSSWVEVASSWAAALTTGVAMTTFAPMARASRVRIPVQVAKVCSGQSLGGYQLFRGLTDHRS